MSFWIGINVSMPACDEGLRVMVFTGESDFAGERFFDIEADELWQDEKTEVAEAVTHWRFHDYPEPTRQS